MKNSVFSAVGIALAAAFIIPALPCRADSDWVVLPFATESGRMLLHAIRDNSKPVMTDLRFEKSGSFKSLRIGNNKSKFSHAGLNTAGVAIVMTGGDSHCDGTPKKSKSHYDGGKFVNNILAKSASAEKAVAYIREQADKKLIAASLIILVVDPGRAFAVECSPKNFASAEITSGLCVYANAWRLPNMDASSKRSFNDRGWAAQREWAVREMLQRARSSNKISVAESIATSRAGALELNTKDFEAARKNKTLYNSPASKYSADGVLFEIDREFPGVLSCAYVAFGPARYTIYLPVALGAAEAIPKELNPAPLKSAALALQKAAKPDTPIDIRYATFEKRIFADFNKTREEARTMLRDKKVDEAKTLLQEALLRYVTEAAAEFGKAAKE
jgi:hypothetical protein